MDSPNPARVLLIIATLGQRPSFLAQTIDSIRSQSVPVDLVIVGPADNQNLQDISTIQKIPLLPDPGSLPEAINLGATHIQGHHEFVNWLNDDDLLEPNTLHAVMNALEENPNATVAFGHCRYIDTNGKELWVSKAGKLAPRILPWGPDLVPQPGMLVRTSAWKSVNGLDSGYSLAFDLDLLLRLKKIGPLIAVNHVVSSFRWHPDSLTVDDRTKNLKESERAKRKALPAALKPISPLWDAPVRWAIRRAANRVSSQAQSKD
jgi:GT2 family glycosyltransferase